jgi:hypothetical protein
MGANDEKAVVSGTGDTAAEPEKLCYKMHQVNSQLVITNAAND